MRLLVLVAFALSSLPALASGYGGYPDDIFDCSELVYDGTSPDELDYPYCYDDNGDEVEYEDYYNDNFDNTVDLVCTNKNVKLVATFSRPTISEGANLLKNTTLTASLKANNSEAFIFEDEQFQVPASLSYVISSKVNEGFRKSVNISTSSYASKKLSLQGYTTAKDFKKEFNATVNMSLNKGGVEYSLKTSNVTCVEK